MTKREQTDEMTKERNEIKDVMKLLDKCVSLNPMCKSEVASVLYGNNYRKAEEVRKETAKEILLLLGKGYDETEKTEFNNLQWYKEFCRELKHRYGVEVEE